MAALPCPGIRGRGVREADGLTLIELAIASGILAVAFVFIIGGIVNISDTNTIVADRTEAGSALSSVLEQLRTMTIDQLLAYAAPAPHGLGASATTTIACIDATGASVPIPAVTPGLASTLPNPLEVRVTVQWRDPRGRLHTQRTSSLFRR
jgi:type II secretory pathway pseudopilin PulG